MSPEQLLKCPECGSAFVPATSVPGGALCPNGHGKIVHKHGRLRRGGRPRIPGGKTDQLEELARWRSALPLAHAIGHYKEPGRKRRVKRWQIDGLAGDWRFEQLARMGEIREGDLCVVAVTVGHVKACWFSKLP